ncbi:MAG: winged helix-turn-helix domain-containing protein [Planctomycetia bacterium]|nr:winged helix-turn-helix domain-containing protein [Planctomycetia bacterium]
MRRSNNQELRKLYKDKGFDGLLSDNYIGCVPKLTCEQEEQLKDHIRKNNYSAAKEIVEYVKQTFNKIYTPEGMVHTLDRLGFTYKKTTIVPGKQTLKTKEFIENYKQLKRESPWR